MQKTRPVLDLTMGACSVAALLILAERETDLQFGLSASRADSDFRDVLMDQVKRLREELGTGGHTDFTSSWAGPLGEFRSSRSSEHRQISAEFSTGWMDGSARAMPVRGDRIVR